MMLSLKVGEKMKLNELQKKLAELSLKTARKESIDVMMESLQNEELQLIEKEKELRAILGKEQADAERLERTSAASLLYGMMGTKEEKLRKEQLEAAAAKMKYDALLKQLNDCRSRMQMLADERLSLQYASEQSNMIFMQIQEELHNDPRYADRIRSLQNEEAENESQKRELSEAVQAGKAALVQIQSIKKSLDNAKGWGTFDIFGGGLMTDIVKHSHLNEAQNEAAHLQVLLSRFQSELSDVHVTGDMPPINIDGFLGFADFFFDGMLADWMVLSRINDSARNVRQVEIQVKDQLEKLEYMQSVRESNTVRLQSEIEELVETAGRE